jgi:ABC-type sugar transport system ATPase subunit
VGRSVEEIYPARAARPAEEILSVRGLGRAGEFHDVSFSLHRGEVVGVFGLVGSGRTAVARSIFGAEPPDSGSIFLDGREVRVKSPQDAVNAGISFVTEDRKRDGLIMSCTLRDNISLATLPQMSHGLILDRRRQDRMVQSKVDDLAIRPSDIGQKARTLSGGNQQKVVIAKWLLSRTRVLLLDEPTRGVDIGAKVEIYHIINALVEAGIGVLLISSEMSEVRGMSDRIIVMREGRLVGNLTRAEADEETLLQYAAGMAGAAGARAGRTT